MTAPVRFALVGTGVMGALHARVIAQSDRARLVRVVEPREAVGREVADRYGARWTPDGSNLSGVDAVVIAAPTEFHHALAGEVLAADLPLLIEKPVCGSLDETEDIVATAEKRGVPLLCGLLERFNPAVLTALALVDNPVHLTVTRHSPYAPRIRTGVAWDLLIHDVDLAIRAFGGQEPTDVRGVLGHFHPSSLPGAEDVAEALLTFGGAALANVSASRIGQRKVRTLVVSEVDRLIEADLIRRDVTIYRHVSLDAATPDGRGYRQQSIMEVPELVSGREPLAAQLDHFLDLLAGTADADAERRSILPAHRAVGRLFADHG
ncbi:Predicted dehydrogenase [Micromonospora haikouensis]|uniref:Predicted dehydrogenase n=1 Tax=Micromonospora haikouensis TaxID=686309 RepID=A0A1C4WZS5_9ACTN|nr:MULTISPECIES: Gfo/Idh/MocA family oxidoreductase [Micromonospora]MDI5938285.1 Gfo/Idh/MocA family oxidoreductase [Micromonospora sp. DH15]OON31080.1 oxidoreductase [Micromonospora sp. Rc5]SCF01686.1 Predicted dehydrogenase [Micromonospora haikouensis]